MEATYVTRSSFRRTDHYARTCPSVSPAARSHARPPATRPSRPSRSSPSATRRDGVRPNCSAVRSGASSWPRRPPLTNGRRRLNVHDHRMLQIDQVVLANAGPQRADIFSTRTGWRALEQLTLTSDRLNRADFSSDENETNPSRDGRHGVFSRAKAGGAARAPEQTRGIFGTAQALAFASSRKPGSVKAQFAVGSLVLQIRDQIYRLGVC